jgi:hypothetical protein
MQIFFGTPINREGKRGCISSQTGIELVSGTEKTFNAPLLNLVPIWERPHSQTDLKYGFSVRIQKSKKNVYCQKLNSPCGSTPLLEEVVILMIALTPISCMSSF